MAWFKVDDGLPASRKILSIPRSVRLSSVGLWTLAGAWSAHQELDGMVPDYMVSELGGTPRLVSALINAGLWSAVPNGSQFNNWREYQPTRSDLDAVRAASAERKREYRKGRTSQGQQVGQHGDKVSDNTTPDPTRPDPTLTTSNEVVKERPATRGSRLSPGWMPSDQSKAKARQDAPGVDHQAEHSTFVDYWIAQPGQKGVKTDWEATWRNWMRRKQADLKGTKQTPEQKARTTLALATDIDMKEISA